jgi:single-strand DNA-binding protein
MYQKIIIIGNLGRDPEMRYTPSGQGVTDFSVATSNRFTTSDGNQVDETTWFRISTWGKLAEVCNQYLKKGRRVLVEGRLIPDKETGSPKVFTRQDGTSGASYEIRADTVKFLSPPSEDGGASGSPSKVAEPDDIPF